jgi:hypothetical protein
MPDDSTDAKEERDVLAEAEQEGIDLSLLRENLRLTPTERVERNLRCLRSLLDVREAGIAHRKKLNG